MECLLTYFLTAQNLAHAHLVVLEYLCSCVNQATVVIIINNNIGIIISTIIIVIFVIFHN